MTVTVAPGGRRIWTPERVAGITPGRKRLVTAVAAGALALAVAIPLIGGGGNARGVDGPAGGTAAPGAGAHAHASHCLTWTISAQPADSASGAFERSVWCARYGGRKTMSSYRFVGGALPTFRPAMH